jgi:Methenyl tetrahydrofolate cyclohydrolase
MKLTEMTLTHFTKITESDAPAPGGGSVAALEGALGIALVRMVAALTAGKKKYAEHENLMQDVMKDASEICRKLLVSVDKDTDAFNQVSAVFTMPKDTDEQKAQRSNAMQEALTASTLIPFETMGLALAALRIAKSVLGKTNDSAASDLGVGALSLKAAVCGAWLNVLINLGGIKDAEFASTYRTQGQAIVDEASLLADEIFVTMLKSM